MKITQIISSDLSGFCDVETGECVVVEADTSPDSETDESSHDRTPEGVSADDAGIGPT